MEEPWNGGWTARRPLRRSRNDASSSAPWLKSKSVTVQGAVSRMARGWSEGRKLRFCPSLQRPASEPAKGPRKMGLSPVGGGIRPRSRLWRSGSRRRRPGWPSYVGSSTAPLQVGQPALSSPKGPGRLGAGTFGVTGRFPFGGLYIDFTSCSAWSRVGL